MKSFKLTQEEFDILIEALEALPQKDQGGNLARKLLLNLVCNGDEEAKQKANEELAVQEQKEEAERKIKKRQVGVIIGKLYEYEGEIVEKGGCHE